MTERPDFVKPGHLDGSLCSYCDEPIHQMPAGQPRSGSQKTKDHLVPKKFAIGGLQMISVDDIAAGSGNGVYSCLRCNGLKGSMFPDQVRLLAAHHDKRAALLRQIADRAEALIKHRRLLP